MTIKIESQFFVVRKIDKFGGLILLIKKKIKKKTAA